MNTLLMDKTPRRLNNVAKYSNSPHAQHITRREDDGAAEQTQLQRGRLATTNYQSQTMCSILHTIIILFVNVE